MSQFVLSPFVSFLVRLVAFIRGHWHVWFDDFKWREFFLAMAAIYSTALTAAGHLQIPAAYQQKAAWFATVCAAFTYILNPKSRQWQIPNIAIPGISFSLGESKGKDIPQNPWGASIALLSHTTGKGISESKQDAAPDAMKKSNPSKDAPSIGEGEQNP